MLNSNFSKVKLGKQSKIDKDSSFKGSMRDLGYGTLDALSGMVGLPDVVNADHYNGDKIGNVIGGGLNVAGGMAATTLGGPTAGAAFQVGSGILGATVNPDAPEGFDNSQNYMQGQVVGNMIAPLAGNLMMPPVMANGGLVPQYANGGKVPPYYTSDPNDPRIQQYNDSLDLYNASKYQYENMPHTSDLTKNIPSNIKHTPRANSKIKKLSKQGDAYLEIYSKDSEEEDFLIKDGKTSGVNDYFHPTIEPSYDYWGWNEDPNSFKNLLVSSFYEGNLKNSVNHLYDKPKQPVIYDPNKEVFTPTKVFKKTISSVDNRKKELEKMSSKTAKVPNEYNTPSLKEPSGFKPVKHSKYVQQQLRQNTPNNEEWQSAMYNQNFAQGGNIMRQYNNGGMTPQYEAEGGEVVQGLGMQNFNGQMKQNASDAVELQGPSHAQGGIDMAGGERVFSDQIKMPGNSKQTIADAADKITSEKGKEEKKKDKYSTDKLMQKTADMNIANLDKQLDSLFALQESLKAPQPQMQQQMPQQQAMPQQGGMEQMMPQQPMMAMGGNLPQYYEGGKTPGMKMASMASRAASAIPMMSSPSISAPSGIGASLPWMLSGSAPAPSLSGRPGAGSADFAGALEQSGLMDLGDGREPSVPNAPREGNSFDWRSAGNKAGSYASAAYNIGMGLFGKPKHVKEEDYYNPNNDEVLEGLKGRTMNINPALSQVDSNANAARNMATEGSGGSGSSVINSALGIQRNQDESDSSLYTQKENMDNQYQAEYLNALSTAGQDIIGARQFALNYNDSSDAAKQGFLQKGISQVQEQKERDIKNDQTNLESVMKYEAIAAMNPDLKTRDGISKAIMNGTLRQELDKNPQMYEVIKEQYIKEGGDPKELDELVSKSTTLGYVFGDTMKPKKGLHATGLGTPGLSTPYTPSLLTGLI